ncbi:hypothetical protein AGMMS49982_17340 [Bacteroidia bacterium]|nr:hypothetical protein AGMMS49982_17340 [Bacteroidia bacterium]
MKQFLIKLSIYGILLVIGAFVLEFILEKGHRNYRTEGFSTWHDIFDSKMNTDAIILGNSRAWCHINPETLDSVLHINSYNLGMDWTPFGMQYVMFKVFEKYNRKPNLVIQNVDFVTLYRPVENINKSMFAPYIHEDLIKNELRKMGMSEVELNIPLFQYPEYQPIMRGLKGLISHSSDDRYKGYQGKEVTWDGSALEKKLSQDSLISIIEPEIVELFDSFLNECKEKEIQVILVFTPMYYKATEFTKDKEQLFNLCHSFAEKYNIPFLDYSHDPLCYDTVYFFNAQHLNKKGAELFSLKLANDIKEQNLYKSGDCGSSPP